MIQFNNMLSLQQINKREIELGASVMTTVKDLALYLIDKNEYYEQSSEFIKHYQQSGRGYIRFARKMGRLVDPQKCEPNQKWHFFQSWLFQRFQKGNICWDSDANKTLYQRIQCPELFLWLLEATGICRCKVAFAKELAENGKKNKARLITIAKEIRMEVPWEAVEEAMKLHKPRSDESSLRLSISESEWLAGLPRM